MQVSVLPLVGAALVVLAMLLLRTKLTVLRAGVGALVVLALVLFGLGLVPVPNVEHIVEELGGRLGAWTYLVVGVLAFLETGAFVGLLAPGETVILVGGVVAGQGDVDVILLIGITWAAAVAGDTTSYLLGRRLGRGFMVKHGPRVKITNERLEQVEAFFGRHGGSTIFIGRFIGLVRAIAPFIAGASRMPLRRFLPYDVLGSGLWASGLVLLGYFFSRSLSTVTKYLGQGTFALGTLVVILLAVYWARRLAQDADERERVAAWIEEQGERPELAPLYRVARPLWRGVIRPTAIRLAGPARFTWNRLTPGDLGLELTTLLAVAAVGGFVVVSEALLIDGGRLILPGDRTAFTVLGPLRFDPLLGVVRVFTDIGTLWVCGPVVLATVAWTLRRGRWIEAVALATGFVATWGLTQLLKEEIGRARPVLSEVTTLGMSFPSGHSSNAVAFIACAVVLVRTGGPLAARFAIVTGACVLAAAVALSRVVLRAHFLSDTLAGLGLGLAVFALVGIVALVAGYLRQNPVPS